ncbi:sensor histidine kinase [Novosphingobium umbonatum]|nr:ATP-binding protein [Novosphingobium umbonatum]
MMRESLSPWSSLILPLVALLLLWTGGTGFIMLAITALLWGLSLFFLWWRLTDVQEPASVERKPNPAEQERALRHAIESALEPVASALLITTRQRILFANAAAREALGGHIVGQDPRIALRHPDAFNLLEAPESDQGAVSATIPGLTRSGSLWQLTRYTVAQGQWIIEAKDRTSEADISRAHTDFVANASHELRTPLSSIIGYVETLADAEGAMEPAITNRFLGTVLREAKRMQSLLIDLMSLSQLEAEKHDAPTAEIELGALIARVVAEFAPPPGCAARVELERGETPFPVTGDVKQIEQVVRNLIDNALKYADADKLVSVALTADARGMAKLTVQDRGPGIAADHLPHLTRRFYRTDPGRSRAAGGTGLGLAIVKHIVERHRGKLDIASTVGVGTTVTIALPILVKKA